MQPITAGQVMSVAYQGAQKVNQWNQETQFTTHVGDALYAGANQAREWDDQYQIRQHAGDAIYAGIIKQIDPLLTHCSCSNCFRHKPTISSTRKSCKWRCCWYAH